MVDIQRLRSFGTGLCREIGIKSAALDVQLMLCRALNKTPLYVQMNTEKIISTYELNVFLQLLKRRLCFEPMAYILGEKEFFGHNFIVNENCLIPRPDTECVVEEALSLINGANSLVYDICTGSGAIGLTLLKENPLCTLIASDISEEALQIAKKNAKQLGVFKRAQFICGDLLTPYKKFTKADVIICNPPYIASGDLASLPPDVKDFEPRLALDGNDEKGLYFYKRLFKEVPFFIKKGGFLVVEIGCNQKDDIERLICDVYTEYYFIKDLAGHTRGMVLKNS